MKEEKKELIELYEAFSMEEIEERLDLFGICLCSCMCGVDGKNPE
jgi:hypothetical protein